MSAADRTERARRFLLCGPERMFGIDGLDTLSRTTCTASMPAGPWLTVDGRTAEVASLGTLVDVALGYLLNSAGGMWSVSTEICLDVLRPLDTTLGPVSCTGSVLVCDDTSAVVAGTVADGAGTDVVFCTMRGLYVRDDLPGPADPDEVAARSYAEPDRSDLDALLSPEVRQEGSTLHGVVSDRHANPRGNLHGGLVLTLVERSAALALPALGATTAVRLQLVRGIPGGSRTVVTSSVLHRGRTLGVVQTTIADPDGRVLATATVTRGPVPTPGPS